MNHKSSQRKRKKIKIETNQYDAPNEIEDGITAYLYHKHNSDSDDISDITPVEQDVAQLVPGPKKNSAFDTLFKVLFTKNTSNSSLLQQEKGIKLREKPKDTTYNSNNNSSKVHPYYENDVNEPLSSNVHNGDARFRYLVNCMYLISEATNQRDLSRFEFIIQDILIEDCLYQNAALKQPVVGRHHIVEAHKSIMRVSDDLHSELEKYSEEEVNGSMILSMDYIMTGTFILFSIYKIIILIFFDGTIMTLIGTICKRDSSDTLWNDISISICYH